MVRWMTPEIAVAPQIRASDVAEIKTAGFRSLVCHRPDGEEPGQPPVAEIEAAARASGLEFRSQPVVSGRITDDDVETFAQMLTELPRPILAYCRSGARSASLWSQADERLRTSGRAG